MNFAEDAHGRLLDEDGKDEDEEYLDKIEEESNNVEDDEEEEKARILE